MHNGFAACLRFSVLRDPKRVSRRGLAAREPEAASKETLVRSFKMPEFSRSWTLVDEPMTTRRTDESDHLLIWRVDFRSIFLGPGPPGRAGLVGRAICSRPLGLPNAIGLSGSQLIENTIPRGSVVKQFP